MSKQDKQHCCGAVVSVLSIVLVAAIIWAGCKKHPDQTEGERHPEEPQPRAVTENIGESVKTDTNASADHKLSLYDVIKTARTWQPVYTSWYHKAAPDLDFDRYCRQRA